MRDFTYNTYKLLLQEFLKNGYTILTVSDYLKKKPKNKFVILRHDVDRALDNALKMAKLEASLGIKSTYYFRTSTFKLPIVKQIAELGHEIGYHYETLFKSKGDYNKALILFEQELNYMRQYFPIQTICAHGNIFMKGINYDIWKQYDFRKYGILGEAYLSLIKNPNLKYYSDTGRRWNNIKNTFELINSVSKEQGNYYILAHPDKWTDNLFSWVFIFLFQGIKNRIKWHILPLFGLRR